MNLPDLRRGAELFNAVENSTSDAAFWWLGQHSFIVKLGAIRFLIDPFLSDVEGRRVPPLFAPSDARGTIDLVLCTHDHLDHIDPVAVTGLAEHTGASFVAPRFHERRMLDLGVPADRLILMNDGEQKETHGLRITAVRSAHEFFDCSDDGLYPFLGYVIEGGGRTLYHSGDTLWWEGLQARLSAWKLDLALLPINGRDARRFQQGTLGNMTYQEAADLAGGLAIGLTVPTHYDMFAHNAEDPELFRAYMEAKYPDHPVRVCEYTEAINF